MSQKSRKVRCYAERVDQQWQAFCIDLNLAVQGDSLHSVKCKLDSMVESYVQLASEQKDIQAQRDMLHRSAPLAIQVRYWQVRAMLMADRVFDRFHEHRERFAEIFYRRAEYC